MTDSGYRAFHNNCGGMVAFMFGDDGYCTGCGAENIGFSDYTLVAVVPRHRGTRRPVCRAHPDDCPNGPEPHAYYPPEIEGLPCCRQPGKES